MRSFAAVAVLGLAALAAIGASTEPAATSSAVATNQATRVKVAKLVKQLGADEYDKREEALKLLVEAGAECDQAISQAMLDAKDEEIIERLKVILSRRIYHLPPISVSLKNAGADDAIRALNKATGVAAIWRIGDLKNGADPRKYNINAANLPFWEAFGTLAKQGEWNWSQRPGLEYEVAAGQPTEGAVHISGPFLIVASATPTIVTLVLWLDPRLSIDSIRGPDISELRDQNGVELQPIPANDPFKQPGRARCEHVAVAKFAYDATTVSKFSLIRGSMECKLNANGRADVKDFKLGTKIEAGPLKIEITKCERTEKGTLNLAWQAASDKDERYQFVLLDGDGVPVRSGNFGAGFNAVSPENFKEPATLRIEWPKRTIETRLNFELRDVAIP